MTYNSIQNQELQNFQKMLFGFRSLSETFSAEEQAETLALNVDFWAAACHWNKSLPANIIYQVLIKYQLTFKTPYNTVW